MGIKDFPAVSVDLKFVSFVNLKCNCKIFVGKGHQISPGTPKAIYAATLLLSGV